MRYSALACVVVGGALMSGSGAVAFADPGDTGSGSSGGSGTPATQSVASTQTTETPVYKTPTPGPISAPPFNIPTPFGPLALPDSRTPLRWGPITFPNLVSSQFTPVTLPTPSSALPSEQPAATEPQGAGPQLPSGASGIAPTVNAAPPSAPPTISLVPLTPDGAPVGPSMTITNPLRDAISLDFRAPIVPQVLPPPIVTILNAMSQQIPVTDLVLAPLMNDTLPPVLSDVILPALLSDIVVPTLPIESGLPTTPVASAVPLSNPSIWSLPASSPPPLELAPMGMDVPQAPLQAPPPLTPPVINQGPQQNPPPPPPDGVRQLSEPVAYRAGYSDYLRNAGMAQITSLALPGIAGILLVTAGGGFIGYRQARAGHVIRAEGIARFLR